MKNLLVKGLPPALREARGSRHLLSVVVLNRSRKAHPCQIRDDSCCVGLKL